MHTQTLTLINGSEKGKNGLHYCLFGSNLLITYNPIVSISPVKPKAPSSAVNKHPPCKVHVTYAVNHLD